MKIHEKDEQKAKDEGGRMKAEPEFAVRIPPAVDG